LPDRRAVLHGERRASRRKSAERTVDVRAAYRRAALDDGETVRREDERRQPRAQLLRGRERSPVQPRALRLPGSQAELHLDGSAVPLAAKRDPAGVLAEAQHLRVRARPRREPLRPEVQRLEQVRLSGPVGPDGQHEARLEIEVEPRVRANVPERDRADDQPAGPNRRAESA
jgi:hypothetical protein